MNEGKGVRNVLAHHFDMLQFKGMLDMDKLAIVGHSFGGATVVASCAKEKRFKLGVALDSWMLPVDQSLYNDVTQPMLLVNTENFQWVENVRDMYNLKVNQDNQLRRVLITIKGTCHQSQTDFQFMTNASFAKFLGMRHTLDPHLAMGLNNKATIGFLAKHLDIPGIDERDDILSGKHDLIIRGTNLDLDLDLTTA
jgi:platelet-activating factor acetylhydrolase